jgi:hypothetical protein
MHASSKMEGKKYYYHSAQVNTTTHLGPFERVDQTAFANVGEEKEWGLRTDFVEHKIVLLVAADVESESGGQTRCH